VAMVKRLMMQCGERGLAHLSLVFGLLAVGTLSLSVATDFWLYTTEALDPTKLDSPSPSSPSPDLEVLPQTAAEVDDLPSDVAYYYDEFNATGELDVGSELDMAPGDDMMFPPIVIARLHSGLWRSCVYFDYQGNHHAWRFGLAVARWPRSIKLLYAGPG